MKSFSVICLLVVVFGVMNVNSVSPDKKQICRCDVPFGQLDQMDILVESATKSIQDRFYCYKWAFDFFCEVTDNDRPLFETRCKAYDENITGTWCREIPL